MCAKPFSLRLASIAVAFITIICMPFGTAMAQYRAQIGCPAEKIDAQSASADITAIQCACFGEMPKYQCQCHDKCGPNDKESDDAKPERRFLLYEGRDIDGYDLRVIRETNFDNCTEQCKTEARCRAFSYDKWNRWCFLKRNLPTELRIEPNSIVAVPTNANITISSRPLVVLRYHNAVFLDPPYRAIDGISYEACRQRCKHDGHCEVFTYIKAQRQCRLIHRPSEYFRNHPTADSGVKRQEPPS